MLRECTGATAMAGRRPVLTLSGEKNDPYRWQERSQIR